MIESITVTNHLGETLTMDLRNPDSSGFQILSIDGLDPVKADIAIADLAGFDGGVYTSARATKRNIIIQLKYLPKPTIEDTRQKAYKYFPLKRRIKLDIQATNRLAGVYGFVESNEVNIFSSSEGSSISIMCPDAYLYDLNPPIVVFSSVTSLFEFPFSNESLVSPLLEMSELLIETTKTVLYTGDAPTGFILHIHATGSATGFVLTDSVSLDTIAIDDTEYASIVGSGIANGDDIYISTVKGSKYAKAYRGGEEYNILNALGKYPTWFELEKGDNLFVYDATSGLANLQFEILHEILYEGI
jgi:hypothetical protein